MTLILLGILAPIALYILIKSQLRKKKGPEKVVRHEAPPSDVDFASLRRSRMPDMHGGID